MRIVPVSVLWCVCACVSNILVLTLDIEYRPNAIVIFLDYGTFLKMRFWYIPEVRLCYIPEVRLWYIPEVRLWYIPEVRLWYIPEDEILVYS